MCWLGVQNESTSTTDAVQLTSHSEEAQHTPGNGKERPSPHGPKETGVDERVKHRTFTQETVNHDLFLDLAK